MTRWLRSILRVPLEQKLLGANLVIVAVALLVLFAPIHLNPGRLTDVLVVVTTLTIGALVNFALVRLALRPIKTLEHVARRVSEGRLAERVPPSIVADRDLAQLSATINDMLDKLAAGRERMRRLGAEVVYAEEKERARVAHELHESVGQSLAAASFQTAAIAYSDDTLQACQHEGRWTVRLANLETRARYLDLALAELLGNTPDAHRAAARLLFELAEVVDQQETQGVTDAPSEAGNRRPAIRRQSPRLLVRGVRVFLFAIVSGSAFMLTTWLTTLH